MIRRLGAAVMLAVALLLVPSTALAAEEVTVSDLTQSSADYAGREISVVGELVADYGFRRDGWMWTQLNGDAYAADPIREGGPAVGGNSGIGIRMPTQLGRSLDPPGRYEVRGPLVMVVGTWNHHDPQRQGETYLEVAELTVVEPGRPMTQDVEWAAILGGLALLAAAASLWRFWRTG